MSLASPASSTIGHRRDLSVPDRNTVSASPSVAPDAAVSASISPRRPNTGYLPPTTRPLTSTSAAPTSPSLSQLVERDREGSGSPIPAANNTSSSSPSPPSAPALLPLSRPHRRTVSVPESSTATVSSAGYPSAVVSTSSGFSTSRSATISVRKASAPVASDSAGSHSKDENDDQVSRIISLLETQFFFFSICLVFLSLLSLFILVLACRMTILTVLQMELIY